MYKNLQLEKMQNPFQCGPLHLKFNSINPDFKGAMSSSHLIIGLIIGEKEPFLFFPPDFFSWLVFKTRKSIERDGIVADSSL